MTSAMRPPDPLIPGTIADRLGGGRLRRAPAIGDIMPAMVDQNPGAKLPALSTDEVRAFIERAPRCKVRVAVLCQPSPAGRASPPSEFVEAQLVNLSRTGMFLACQ